MTTRHNGTTRHTTTDQGTTASPSGLPLVSLDSVLFQDVQVSLEAKLGQVTMTIAKLLALKAGSIVTLERSLTDLVEIRLNQSVIARGEIVAVDDNFGVRIVEIAPR